MKLHKYIILLAAAVTAVAGFSAAQIDPRLVTFAQGQTEAKFARVIALMDLKINSAQSPKRYDWAGVQRYLKYLSSTTLQSVAASLNANPVAKGNVQFVRAFWINSSFTANVTPQGLKALAETPGIVKVYVDAKLGQEPYQRRVSSFRPMDDVSYSYDFKDIGLDRVIAEFPQIDGTGVLLGHIDTGVQGDHPAVVGKINSFFDAGKKAMVPPYDDSEHGTHTAGTMVGGDRKTNFIGMAPGARLQSALGLSSLGGSVYSNELAAMEHLLDPDKNPGTPDFPRAINNSWNCGGAPDVELFYRAISAWEAAGILPVFSAGNSGPRPKTITPPHEHPLAFAIAATGENGNVTSFSSRGPGIFQGKETQKPDISAPGDNIYSSVPGGGYSKMSGTSMAAPHVAGASALLFQINPRLTPVQVREIFIRSASPRDASGAPGTSGQWNASYGFGKLNVYEAVKLAIATTKPVERFSVFVTSPFEMAAKFIAEGGRREFPLTQAEFDYRAMSTDTGMVPFERVWK